MNTRSSDLLWLAIRILGLFFLARSLMALPAVPTNVIVLRSVSSEVQTDIEDMDSISRKIEEYAVANLVEAGVKFLLFGVVGLYLCRRGRALYWLVRVPSNGIAGSE